LFLDWQLGKGLFQDRNSHYTEKEVKIQELKLTNRKEESLMAAKDKLTEVTPGSTEEATLNAEKGQATALVSASGCIKIGTKWY